MVQASDRGGWQSMANAPRDGTRILVSVRASEQGGAAVDTAYWGPAVKRVEAGWRAADSHPDCIIAYQQGELMGWMPLPKPGGEKSAPRPMGPEEVAESGGSGI